MSLFSTLVMLILLIGVLIQGGHGAETTYNTLRSNGMQVLLLRSIEDYYVIIPRFSFI